MSEETPIALFGHTRRRQCPPVTVVPGSRRVTGIRVDLIDAVPRPSLARISSPPAGAALPVDVDVTSVIPARCGALHIGTRAKGVDNGN